MVATLPLATTTYASALPHLSLRDKRLTGRFFRARTVAVIGIGAIGLNVGNVVAIAAGLLAATVDPGEKITTRVVIGTDTEIATTDTAAAIAVRGSTIVNVVIGDVVAVLVVATGAVIAAVDMMTEEPEIRSLPTDDAPLLRLRSDGSPRPI
jgi:hypothetical protein